jgi:hypothetical protein
MDKLHELHISFMLRCREAHLRYDSLGATKIKVFHTLQDKGLMKKDEDGFVFNSERGDIVLDNTLIQFNAIIETLP